MADRAGGVIISAGYSDGAFSDRAAADYTLPAKRSKAFRGRPPLVSQIGDSPSLTYFYRMRAQDSGAPPTVYVSWTVVTTPDFAGVGYSGGTPTPVGPFVPGSIVVAETWREA